MLGVVPRSPRELRGVRVAGADLDCVEGGCRRIAVETSAALPPLRAAPVVADGGDDCAAARDARQERSRSREQEREPDGEGRRAAGVSGRIVGGRSDQAARRVSRR